jgi:CubicO group peptidase (beta-lactamase class C family)
MKSLMPVLLFCLFATACSNKKNNTKKEETPKPAQSIQELQGQLEKILKDTHTPGVSIAIVRHDSPEWVTALGKADVASNRDATADTLFRIGSTSKAFASLSLLKLANEGKVSLLDPVHKLAPELWFDNKWESSDPILLVDLVEHTTGWDDLHLREYARDGKNMSLREAFDVDHHSRVSRWPPATRMSYCNSGPAVAAFVVEKVTGQRFEDYVSQNFFLPIGMNTATYFEAPNPPLTTLYHDDGKTPYPYWHIMYRPAGSINASAKDMANYVSFYLNRGTVKGVTVMPSASIDRMEVPTRTWGAKAGLKAGYGMSNYASIREGFVYHGHDGGVEGGLTEMAYLPNEGVGYFYSINAGNGDAFDKIGKAIRSYVTRNLQKPPVPAPVSLPAEAHAYAGWYLSDSPRNEMTHFLDRLLGLILVQVKDEKLITSSISDQGLQWIPVSGMLFREVPKKDPPEPVATVALLPSTPEGRFIQVGGGGLTLRQIPSWSALLQIALIVWFVLALIAILLYAPFWILGGLNKRRRRPAERSIRLWPLLAVLSLLTIVVILQAASSDLISLMGNRTAYSVSFSLATVAFALCSLGALLSLWLAPVNEVRKGVRRFSAFVILPLVLAAGYLAYWGMIGFRSWN